jgi:hypothetical protein
MKKFPEDHAFTSEDKLKAEVLKLYAEEKNLSRPFYKQIPIWIAIGTLILSVGGNLTQCSKARDDNNRIQDENNKIEAENAKAETKITLAQIEQKE